MNRPRTPNAIPLPPGPHTGHRASNGILLLALPDEEAHELAVLPSSAWTSLFAKDGSGDEVRLIQRETPVVLYIRGSDKRCLLSAPAFQGDPDRQPGFPELLDACREISARVDRGTGAA